MTQVKQLCQSSDVAETGLILAMTQTVELLQIPEVAPDVVTDIADFEARPRRSCAKLAF